MATETGQPPVNGHYNPPQGPLYDAYPQAPQATSATTPAANPSHAVNAVPSSNTTNTATEGNADISKDEVGWYFVEQYYTTLSRSPEKLHVRHDLNIFKSINLTRCSSSIPSVPNSSLVSKLRKYRSLLARR